MPVQCPSCRTLNRDTATFCDSCGAHLAVAQQPATPSSPVSRPQTLPEEKGNRLSAPAFVPARAEPLSRAPIAVPNSLPSRGGPSFGAWIVYLLLLLVASFAVFLLALEMRIISSVGTLPEYLFIAFVLLVLSVGTFTRKSGHQDLYGTVTQLRQSMPMSPSGKSPPPPMWRMLLQRTDRNWQPLVDKQGFLQPVIEVSFLPQTVRGAAIEEGSRVAVRGRLRRGSVRAKSIWNLALSATAGAAPDAERSFGRVTDLQPPTQIQDTRSPEGRMLEVRSFRLQPTSPSFELLRDAGGELLSAVPVEIRARVITGALQEGDRVELRGQYVRGMLYPREVYNHSAGGASLVITGWTGVAY